MVNANGQMQWVNVLSTESSLEAAIAEVVEQAEGSLSAPADLALVFISSAFSSEYSRLMPLLKKRLSSQPVIIGCGGGGVVGMVAEEGTQEIEHYPALSLSLAHLPNVDIAAFHLEPHQFPDLDSPPDAWVNLIGVPPAQQPNFILLADPFSAKITDLLQGLDFAYPGSVKVGGLTNGGMNTYTGLFCNYQLYREGTVGLALSGQLVMEAIVAQGCRPIGQTYRVTEGERNILLGLAAQIGEELSQVGAKSRLPLEVLQELIQNLSDEDRHLAQDSLFVGVAQTEFKTQLEPGDFLIRNLVGVDPRAGAIAIGDRVRPGQRIQFHLRDAKTSAEDLRVLLERYQKQSQTSTSAIGALMFSCMGRGEGLYGKPNFDSTLFQHYVGEIPLSGFFCNGEIGPVGGTTFLHGYTSVFGICRPL